MSKRSAPAPRRVSPLPPAVGSAVLTVVAGRVASAALLLDHPRWQRQNYRGASVTLTAGPALVGGLVAAGVTPGGGPRLPLLVAGAGAAGLIDDLYGQTHARGLRGHWRALRAGTLTTGMAKLAALALLGLVAAPAAGHRHVGRTRTVVRRSVDAALIAGCANLVNLLDLRPGRALKVAAVALVPLAAGRDLRGDQALAGLAAVGAVLPDDLRERAMIGDCGANAVGAFAGWLLAARGSDPTRWAALAAVCAATLASERFSFSAVIDAHPTLRALDRLGRAA